MSSHSFEKIFACSCAKISGDTKYFCASDFARTAGPSRTGVCLVVLRTARVACLCIVEQNDSNAQRLIDNSLLNQIRNARAGSRRAARRAGRKLYERNFAFHDSDNSRSRSWKKP